MIGIAYIPILERVYNCEVNDFKIEKMNITIFSDKIIEKEFEEFLEDLRKCLIEYDIDVSFNKETEEVVFFNSDEEFLKFKMPVFDKFEVFLDMVTFLFLKYVYTS